MAKLQFSFITGENERVEPVITGACRSKALS
jgi:hypothetical protein